MYKRLYNFLDTFQNLQVLTFPTILCHHCTSESLPSLSPSLHTEHYLTLIPFAWVIVVTLIPSYCFSLSLVPSHGVHAS